MPWFNSQNSASHFHLVIQQIHAPHISINMVATPFLHQHILNPLNPCIHINKLLGWNPKSITWYNKFGIHYLFNDIPISLLSILIPCIILYEHSCLYFLHCTWLRWIRNCIEYLSHGFLTNRWLVHN